MSQIHINPELLNKIDKIFSRVVEEVYTLDKSFAHWYETQIVGVGLEIARFERELSSLQVRLQDLWYQHTALKNKEAGIEWQIASINLNDCRDADEKSFKMSQMQDLRSQAASIKNQTATIYGDITSTKNKESLCKSNLEREKSHSMLLTQKKNALLQNSSIASLKSSDLLEEASKKVANIKNSIDGYNSVRVSDSLGQSGGFSAKENPATTTIASTSDALSFVKHHYESFSIEIFANKAKVILLPAQESFEIKIRDRTLFVINKSKTLVQVTPQEYFETIECIAKENALYKVVAWVEENIEIYKEYGFSHKNVPTASGVEMHKEYIL